MSKPPPKTPTLDWSQHARDGRPVYLEHRAMACEWGLLLIDVERSYARQLARALFDEVDRLEHELSRFISSSDIARINATPPGTPIHVGIEALECLQIAGRIHNHTAGAFDIACTEEREGDAAAPHAAPRLRVDPASRTVTRTFADTRIDLGGIGKGYALDQLIPLLNDWNISAALLHAGQSTVYAHQSPPEHPAWSIALRHPDDTTQTIGTIDLCNQALSGSGIRIHGHHIIDPRTHQPATARSAAWSIAPAAALADALSTAAIIMSPQQSQQCIDTLDDASLLTHTAPHAGATNTQQLRQSWQAFGIAFADIADALNHPPPDA